MQLKTLLIGTLLPLGLMADPTPEAEAEAAGESLDARAFSRPQHCKIIGGSSTVNCRTGPKTSYKVKRKLSRGTSYDFWCVYSGECVTVNGFRNCGWHYSKALDCFVSGHYTDNHCTLARLGGCGNFDDDKAAAKPFN